MSQQHNGLGYDECALRGICSISPALSSMQAVIFVYMRGLAFYLCELGTLGAENKKVKQDFLDAFSGLISNVEYSQEHLNKVISVLYEDMIGAKGLYKEICARNNISPNYRKSTIKISNKFNVTEAIKQGQKYFAKSESQLAPTKKRKLDILIIILKSICMYVVELQDMNVDTEDYFKAMIKALGSVDVESISEKQIESMINEYVQIDHELLKKTFDVRKAEFGEFVSSEVSISTRPGKAILVAGNNLKELELILQATRDKNIDVYTHGQLVIAHAFSKLKEYPNLVGHYGKGIEHGIFDFSEFPGAIFLTKLSLYKVERLYRSRVFTSDKISPVGVVTLKDNNFEPLINSALSAEGFTDEVPEKYIEVGIVEGALVQKISEIAKKIENNEIKHIFAIGVSNQSNEQKEYFEKFLGLLKSDCFVFSLSYTNNSDNVLFMNFDYGFPIAYNVLEDLAKTKSVKDLNPVVMYTRCEPHTVPNLFYMKSIGIDKIYFGGCSSSLINPALIDTVKEMLGIRQYSTPQEDMKMMLAEEG